MSSTEITNTRHAENAHSKALEAVAAIDWLIAEGFAGINDRRSGLHEFRAFLFGTDEEMAGLYWSAVGVAHAALFPKKRVKMTKFESSRSFVARQLTAKIDELDAPAPIDPFEGLTE